MGDTALNQIDVSIWSSRPSGQTDSQQETSKIYNTSDDDEYYGGKSTMEKNATAGKGTQECQGWLQSKIDGQDSPTHRWVKI